MGERRRMVKVAAAPREARLAIVDPNARRMLGDLLDELVVRVADAITERMQGRGEERYYDGATAPMGRKAFLRLAGARAFPSFTMGRRVVARRTDVERWVESQERRKGAAERRASEPDEDDRALAEAGVIPQGSRVAQRAARV